MNKLEEITEIILKDLPKMSTNKYYAGMSWPKRKKIKDTYTLLVKSQIKGMSGTNFFSKKNSYYVSYNFFFKENPLDATNCSVMVKMIEDILFESDGYKTIIGFICSSNKTKNKENDFVKVNIYSIS